MNTIEKTSDKNVEFFELLATSELPLVYKEQIGDLIANNMLSLEHFEQLYTTLKEERLSQEEFEKIALEFADEMEALPSRISASQDDIVEKFISDVVAEEQAKL